MTKRIVTTSWVPLLLFAAGCTSPDKPPRRVEPPRARVKAPPRPPDVLPYGLVLGRTEAQVGAYLEAGGHGSEVCAVPLLARRRVVPPRYLGLAVSGAKCGRWPLHEITLSFPEHQSPETARRLWQKINKALNKKLGKAPRAKKVSAKSVLTWSVPGARVEASMHAKSFGLPGNGTQWEIDIEIVFKATRKFPPPPGSTSGPSRPTPRRPSSASLPFKKTFGLDVGMSLQQVVAHLAKLGAKVTVKGQEIYHMGRMPGKSGATIAGSDFSNLEAKFQQGGMKWIKFDSNFAGDSKGEAQLNLAAVVRNLTKVLGRPQHVRPTEVVWQRGKVSLKVGVYGEANGPGMMYMMVLELR